MLRGIDISHWDDVNLHELKSEIDFVIIKATQGTRYVDHMFSTYLKDAIECGYMLGIYHFADGQNPQSEARHFYDNVKQYIGAFVPVLDYEISTDDDCYWCESFICEFERLSGVYPMLYVSASLTPLFNSSWIPDWCALWVAGYPIPQYSDWVDMECPYNVGAWGKPDIWQFTSTLKLPGKNGLSDANIAYMSEIGFESLYGGVGDMTVNDLLDAKVHTAYGDYTVRDILSWTYSYTRDMQPQVADLEKRVKSIEKSMKDDKR